jgi:hypothetical protein
MTKAAQQGHAARRGTQGSFARQHALRLKPKPLGGHNGPSDNSCTAPARERRPLAAETADGLLLAAITTLNRLRPPPPGICASHDSRPSAERLRSWPC